MEPQAIRKLIGQNIKRLRKDINLTQKKFGKLIKISGGNVSSYERGSNSFPIDKLPLILKTLQCTVEELFHPLLETDKIDLRFFEIIREVKSIYRMDGGPEELEKVLRWIAHDLMEKGGEKRIEEE